MIILEYKNLRGGGKHMYIYIYISVNRNRFLCHCQYEKYKFPAENSANLIGRYTSIDGMTYYIQVSECTLDDL